MKVAELHANEDLRLADLSAYQIMDTPREQEFDELAELTQILTGCPIVAIGFLDETRHWFKSAIGVTGTSIERRLSICSHTIAANGSLVVENLEKDERFWDHPMVQGGICLRFYAGSSIFSPGGLALGTLCVGDIKPRQFSPEQLRTLEIISRQISKLLEARLHNQLLAKRAEKLIELERRTAQRSLAEHEQVRQQVGYQLHEGFAQTVAACQTFLSLAEQDENSRQSMVRLTREALQSLTKEMRDYSRQITPTTMKKVNVGDMLRSLAADVEKQASFSIRLITEGGTRSLDREVGLALFRNVQEYLQRMKSCGDVNAVQVRLKAGCTLSLLLLDDRPPQSAALLEQDTVIRTIHNRTLHYGGSVIYKAFSVVGNAVLISLPVVNYEPAQGQRLD